MLGSWVGDWLLVEAEKKELNSLILEGSRRKVWFGKASWPMISWGCRCSLPGLPSAESGLASVGGWHHKWASGKKIRESVLQRWAHCQWGLGFRESHSRNHLGYRLGGKEACFKLRKISEAQRQHLVPKMKIVRGRTEWLTPSFPKLF